MFQLSRRLLKVLGVIDGQNVVVQQVIVVDDAVQVQDWRVVKTRLFVIIVHRIQVA